MKMNETYAAAKNEALQQLEMLRLKIESHNPMERLNRQRIDWGHIGDMNHVANQLKQMVENR
jgi:hypothetical protein